MIYVCFYLAAWKESKSLLKFLDYVGSYHEQLIIHLGVVILKVVIFIDVYSDVY